MAEITGRKPYDLLVPLAGRASRMKTAGFNIPKPLIFAGNRTIIERSMLSIDHSQCNIIFVVLQEDDANYGLGETLKKWYSGAEVVVIPALTEGAICTCLAARHLIGERPLIIYCPDVEFYPQFVPQAADFEPSGFILTFKANSPNYSYVLADEGGVVSKVAEKLVISQFASVGVYCFQSGDLFKRFADEVVCDNDKNGAKEFFICPLYNRIITNGGSVWSESIDKIYVFGTPSELLFCEEVVFPYRNVGDKFILCSDHSGFDLKEQIRVSMDHLMSDYLAVDCGCYTGADCDYSDYLAQAVKVQSQNPGSYILAFCRSGNGISIAANKYPGIRSALIRDKWTAQYAIRHNAANCFSIPSKYVSYELFQEEILPTFAEETFDGGRFQNRLMAGAKNGI